MSPLAIYLEHDLYLYVAVEVSNITGIQGLVAYRNKNTAPPTWPNATAFSVESELLTYYLEIAHCTLINLIPVHVDANSSTPNQIGGSLQGSNGKDKEDYKHVYSSSIFEDTANIDISNESPEGSTQMSDIQLRSALKNEEGYVSESEEQGHPLSENEGSDASDPPETQETNRSVESWIKLLPELSQHRRKIESSDCDEQSVDPPRKPNSNKHNVSKNAALTSIPSQSLKRKIIGIDIGQLEVRPSIFETSRI